MKRIYVLLLILYSGVYVFGQNPADTTGNSVPEQSGTPANRDGYKPVISEEDTLFQTISTEENRNTNFRKMPETGEKQVFRTDWMNSDWSTKTFNPYKTNKVKWPVLFNFENNVFTMPTDGVITSRYGWRRGRPHKGIDLDLVTGDNVKAAMAGKVRFARYYGGFGNCIVVRHENGLETIYAHLAKILIKPDTYVYSGQVIGKGGNTGHSFGSHLHFEVRYKNNPINPEYLFDFEKEKHINAPQIYVSERWADPHQHRSYKKSNIQVRTQPLYAMNNGPSFSKTEEDHSGKSLKKQSQSGPSSLAKNPEKESSSFQKNQFHTVQRGDTLAKIANRYSTSVKAICELNGITKSSVLRVGNEIRVR